MWLGRFVKDCVMCRLFLLLLQNAMLLQAASPMRIDQVLGCFHTSPLCSNENCRVMPDYSAVLNPKHSLSVCAATCLTKKCTYFGKDAEGNCFCGKYSPRIYGQVSILLCNKMCTDEEEYAKDDAFRCGGQGYLSVYRTCTTGRYGEECKDDCHCLNQGTCSYEGYCASKRCADGWQNYQNRCVLRDCGAFNGNCSTACRSTTGDVSSCNCLEGYRLVVNVTGSCQDINECASEGQNCSNCVNTNGSSTCTCEPGFTSGWINKTTPVCIDMDECANGSICTSFNCSNTFGSFRCICPTGYSQQSTSPYCKDIDECSLSSVGCNNCVNNPGSYVCACNSGFVLVNSRCEADPSQVVTTRPSVSPSQVTDCRINGVLLSGGSQTNENSYAYRRSATVQFQATVQSTCQLTQPLKYLWKITPYSTTSSTATPLLQETLQVDYYIFNLATAEFGNYVTDVSVMQPSSGSIRFIQVSSETYFQVVRTELHAILRGGSAVTIDIKETVKLDASLSVDPDKESSGISKLHYSWYCVKGKKILPMVAGRLADETDCSGTWSGPVSTAGSFNGFPTPYTTLDECKKFCLYDLDCKGIYQDDSQNARAHCWVKIPDSPSNQLGSVNYYALSKGTGCSRTFTISANSPVQCEGTWSLPQSNMHAAGGIPTHDQNSLECQRHCILDRLCKGIDLRYILGSPYCWLMIQPGTQPLNGSVHLDLLRRTGCDDTTNVSISDCIANEHVLLSTTSEIAEFPSSAFFDSSLQPDYTFTVVVSKPNFLSDSASQTVTLIDKSPTYNININCELNCDLVMNPSYALVLKANCLRCLQQSYAWSISSSSKGPVRTITAGDTSGGLNDPVLKINPNVFKSAANDLYSINLIVTFSNQVSRSYNYSFETTGSPRVERCYIAPIVGYAMKTDFSISCVGGVGNVPLTYTFTLRSCTRGGDTSILYKGINPEVQYLKLPAGDADHSYMICISATISDRYTVKTTVELRATVSPDTFTLADLEDMTRNASRLKAQGDIAGSTCLLDLIAFTTNDLTQKNILKDSVGDKKQFRLSLVNAISSVASTDGGANALGSNILQQSVSALRKATDNPDEIDAHGITNAIDLRKLTSNIGDSGDKLQPVVRTAYYEQSYRQLFQVGSNLMSSAQSARKSDASQEPEKGKNVVDTVMDVLAYANKKLAMTTFLDRNTTIKTKAFVASINALEPSDTQPTTVADEKFAVSFPPELFSGVPSDEANEFKIQMIAFKDNPFWWSKSSDQITSGCASIVVTRQDVVHDAPKSMSGSVAISLPAASQPMDNVEESVASIYPENVAFFTVAIDTPGGTGVILKMIINADSNQLDGTATFRFCCGRMTDVRARLAVSNYCDCVTVWTAVLSNTKLPQIMEAKLEADMTSELGNFVVVEYANANNVTIAVTLKTSQLYCRYWEKESSKWDHSGCTPDVERSTTDVIVCNCKHLSSFAGSFVVKPNSIDIVKSLDKFLVPWQNPIGLILVIVLWLLFLLALLWARRKDKLDALMALPIDLEDNSINARYVYLVTVFTGSRYGSGTTSDVYICLIGDVGTSASHRLQCQEYAVLQQGHVNVFILRTVMPLGRLRAIRVWHYNSGKHPQWFLSRVIVYNPQSCVASHFLCQSWLTLNMENGVVDRTFLVATPQEVEGFQHLFIINALRGLNDKHIWASVVGRPPLSTFSRMQRVACCLSLILGYLLTNLMFFQVTVTEEQKNKKIGVFTLDWSKVAIAIESALVMFPVTLLTVTIFRNVRPRPEEKVLLRQWEKAVDAKFDISKAPTKPSSSKTSLATSVPESSSLNNRPSTGKQQHEPQSSSISSNPSIDKQQRDVNQTDGMYTPKSSDSSKTKSNSMSSNSTQYAKPSDDSSGSSLNTTKSPESSEPEISLVYSEDSTRVDMSEGSDGMYTPKSPSESDFNSDQFVSAISRSDDVEFHSVIEGDVDVEENVLPWWTIYIAWSLVMCASIIFTFFIILYTFEFGLQKSIDWLQVVILSFLTGIFIQEPLKVVATAIIIALIFKRSEDLQISNSESVTEDSVRGLQAADHRHLVHFNQLRTHPHYHPPTSKSVITARDVLVRELIMYRIVWEIVRYFLFIVLALVITNIRRDYNIFLLNNSYKRGLFDQQTYRQIVERDAFWKWTLTSWVDFMYSKDQTTDLGLNSSYINSSETYISSETASENKVLGLMGSGTSVLMRSPRFVRFPKGTDSPLQFLYSNDTGTENTVSLGMTRKKAEEVIISLMNTNWIHRHTGGACLEAVSYTASADLLSILVVIIELPTTGGINVYSYFHTLKFHQYLETFQLVTFGLEIVYVVFTLWFMVYVLKRICHSGGKKFFRSIWNWLDLIIVLLSVCLIVVYGVLNVLLFNTVKTYEKTRELQFTYVAMLDILLTSLLGFVCVVGIIKCLQLLRFSPLINGLVIVLSKAASYIVAFLIYSFWLLVVFVLFLHVLLCTAVSDFQSVGRSLLTLILAVSKQYNYNQVYKFDRLWALLFLACALIFKLIILNMIFAILSAAMREIKTLSQVNRDAEFLHMLFNKVFGWLDFEGRKERKKANKSKVTLEPSDETVTRSDF